MNKFAKFTLLVFVPIVLGVVCFIVGSTTSNNTVFYVGVISMEAGVPATMIILLIVGLTLGSMGKLGGPPKSGTTDATSSTGTACEGNDDKEREQDDGDTPSDEASAADNKTVADEAQDGDCEAAVLSQREREQKAIDAVNSTSRFESRVNMANYEMQSIAEGMRNAPKWGIAVGLTGFFLLVADLIVATVLAINEYFIGAIVCAALFAGFVITAFIVMTISRARSKNGDISKAQKITEGIVKTCFMAGTSTTKSGMGQTVRITGVTYRVIIIADGVEYGAFSDRFYETDEKVTIAVMGKKRAKIVGEGEIEKDGELEELNN